MLNKLGAENHDSSCCCFQTGNGENVHKKLFDKFRIFYGNKEKLLIAKNYINLSKASCSRDKNRSTEATEFQRRSEHVTELQEYIQVVKITEKPRQVKKNHPKYYASAGLLVKPDREKNP
jgi:hypothetical protein